jgi:hypothetical protein
MELDLDEYLELTSGARADKIVPFYEAILASLLRKFLDEGRKIELNLNHVYKDTFLDVTINDEDPSKVKVTWREV